MSVDDENTAPMGSSECPMVIDEDLSDDGAPEAGKPRPSSENSSSQPMDQGECVPFCRFLVTSRT
jgi:hypothetical protein